VTSSFGVAELGPGQSGDDLMREADAALYRAKAEGKNRVATSAKAHSA
jgi:PleD family two-component response regulator